MGYSLEGERIAKNFSDYLKHYRVLNGMTQEDLAKRLETTKQVISNYENGKHTPKIDVAFKIASKLGVPLESMLGVEAPSLEEELLIYFRALSDEGQKELIKRASEMIYVYGKKNKKTSVREAL